MRHVLKRFSQLCTTHFTDKLTTSINVREFLYIVYREYIKYVPKMRKRATNIGATAEKISLGKKEEKLSSH